MVALYASLNRIWKINYFIIKHIKPSKYTHFPVMCNKVNYVQVIQKLYKVHHLRSIYQYKNIIAHKQITVTNL